MHDIACYFPLRIFIVEEQATVFLCNMKLVVFFPPTSCFVSFVFLNAVGCSLQEGEEGGIHKFHPKVPGGQDP